MAVEEFTGTCDICAKPVDARVEDCCNIICTAGCSREQGDLYHVDCVIRFIAQGAKGTARHIPKLPYSNFPCPKGKGKGSETQCKGRAGHCKRIIYKADVKAAVPPQVLLQNEKQRQKDKAAAGKAPAGAGAAAAKKPPPAAKPTKPKASAVSEFTSRLRLTPVPTVPKPDPLGRNLGGAANQELPPGYVEEEAADGGGGGGKGKAAKKNQKRAAKRKEDGGSNWDTSSATGSVGDSSALAGVEGAGPSFSSRPESSRGWPEQLADDASVTSGQRFITDIDAFHAVLSRHMGYSDSELEYEESEDPMSPHGQSPAAAAWTMGQEQVTEADDTEGWTPVRKGKATASPPQARSTNSPPSGSSSSLAAETELRQQEDEQLRAAVQASMEENAAAAASAQAAVDAEYAAALERAMQESIAAEQEKRRREEEEQAALLAAFEARKQQPFPQQQQHHWYQPAAASDAWGAPSAADSQAAHNLAATHHHAAAATHTYQQQPLHQPAPPPAPTAAAHYGYTYAGPAIAASAVPAPLVATHSAAAVHPAATAAATGTFLSSAAAMQQEPWLQSKAAAPAAVDDDDDLGDLLALLTT